MSDERDDVRFELDPRLQSSSATIAHLELCEARLQADRRWPWVVLVPRRPGLVELDQLDVAESSQLMAEISCASRAVRALGLAIGRPVSKLNVGALGNVVSQLHVHIVGRRDDDAAWPAPVWGFGTATPYDAATLYLAREVLEDVMCR